MTRISIVEDQQDIARQIATVIDGTPDLQVAGVYHTAEDALAMLPADRADIVLMDIQLPGMNGLECMVRLLRHYPDLAFLMFTIHDDDERLFDALRFGASGYILKEERIGGIMRAIRNYLRGDAPMSPAIATRVVNYFRQSMTKKTNPLEEALTPKQFEIVQLVARGLKNGEIALQLGNTDGTIRQHIKDIFRKLRVANRTELALLYHRHEEK